MARDYVLLVAQGLVIAALIRFAFYLKCKASFAITLGPFYPRLKHSH
jgi:hypothetical protein